MTQHIIDTEPNCTALGVLVDKLFGYPSKGVHFGSGIHVVLGDTPGPGWTLRHDEVRKHPKKSQWAYPIDAAVTAALGDAAKLAKVSVADAATLTNAAAAAVKLDATWVPAAAAEAGTL